MHFKVCTGNIDIFNIVVLLGQLWPEGTSFAKWVNIFSWLQIWVCLYTC